MDLLAQRAKFRRKFIKNKQLILNKQDEPENGWPEQARIKEVNGGVCLVFTKFFP